MNLQRMTELLQKRGWVESGNTNDFFGFFDVDFEYMGWAIALCDVDDGYSVHICNPELDAYWSHKGLFLMADKGLFSMADIDFAEKTIRDVEREYTQSPGQLSLFETVG